MKTNTVLAPVVDHEEQLMVGKQMAIDAYVRWCNQRPEFHETTAHTLAAGLLESMKDVPDGEKEELLALVLSELLETGEQAIHR